MDEYLNVVSNFFDKASKKVEQCTKRWGNCMQWMKIHGTWQHLHNKYIHRCCTNMKNLGNTSKTWNFFCKQHFLGVKVCQNENKIK
jgi:hypothetical protein